MQTSASPYQKNQHPRKKVIFFALFAALLACHVCANFWWLHYDNHSVQSDESLHMKYAREYYEILTQDAETPLIDRFIDVFDKQNQYPPLSHLCAAGALAIFGYSPDITAATQTLFFVILLLGVYAIGRCFLGPWQALFATTITSFSPLLYCASRNFMTDFLSAAFVVWAVYCLIKSDRYRDTTWVFCFALLNGLGIMARQTTPVFYIVPCLAIILWGFLSLFSGNSFDRKGFKILTLNCIMTLVVSLGIAAPWYMRHMEFLRGFWNERWHDGEGVIDTITLQTLRQPMALMLCIAVALVALYAVTRNLSLKNRILSSTWFPPVTGMAIGAAILTVLLRSEVSAQYALFLIQDGVFLPLFLLALIGLCLSPGLRFRNKAVLVTALWLLGSYLLLSFAFNSRVPRYFVPAVAPLALFAALALCAIPAKTLRRAAMVGTLLVLLLQFSNLTFFPLGTFANVQLPPASQNTRWSSLATEPLTLWKNHIVAGNYAFHTAQREDGFADRLLKAMARDMAERRPLYEDWANYQRLTDQHQFEGMWYSQEHYWPHGRQNNPFALNNLPTAMRPPRAIASRWQHKPEELKDLEITDFIMFKVRQRDRGSAEELERYKQHTLRRESEWTRYFEERGFEVIDHFFEERYNSAEGGFFTLMGKSIRDKKVVHAWDFAADEKAGQSWHFTGNASDTPDGVLRITNRGGPAMELRNADMNAGEFNTVRIATRAVLSSTNTILPLDKINFFWAAPEHVASGKWPYSNERGINLYRVGEELWEGSLERRFQWKGPVAQMLFSMALPPPIMNKLTALQQWDFTTLEEEAWEWRFGRSTDKATHGNGVFKMLPMSGPVATLSTSIPAKDFDALRIGITATMSTKNGFESIPLQGVQVYWATEDTRPQTAEPFTSARSAKALASDENAADSWSVPLSNSPHWKGNIQMIQISALLPDDKRTRSSDHFAVMTANITLLKALPDGPPLGESQILVKTIEFLK
jgi:4-amino-4-deoxy-L-arabinose transferase-like glycosyltransferase